MVRLPLAIFALAAVSTVSGAFIPSIHLFKHALLARKAKPPTYDEGYLENYQTYHTRYLALGCEHKHGKPFFNQCCHPLLATETLDTARPPQCRPGGAALSSAALAEPTSTVKTPADDGKHDGPHDPAPSNPPASKSKDSDVKQAPPPSSSSKKSQPSPKPESSSQGGGSQGGGSQGGSHTGGIATFFFQKGNAGACGQVHSDNDLICALDTAIYGNTGARSQFCGKQIRITASNGKSVTVTVADACPTCNNANSIDLSVGAFTQLASESQGTIDITWDFAD